MPLGWRSREPPSLAAIVPNWHVFLLLVDPADVARALLRIYAQPLKPETGSEERNAAWTSLKSVLSANY